MTASVEGALAFEPSHDTLEPQFLLDPLLAEPLDNFAPIGSFRVKIAQLSFGLGIGDVGDNGSLTDRLVVTFAGDAANELQRNGQGLMRIVQSRNL